MKKRVIAALLAFTVSTSLLACGNKAEEPVKEEPETSVVEEAKVEPEPVVEEKEAEVVEEELEEPETDYSYIQLYMTEIGKLHNSGQADRFALVNVDGDDIPELVAVYSAGNDEYHDETVFLYTILEDEISLLQSHIVGMFNCHLEFSEGNNVIYSGGGDVFLSHSFEKIENGKLQELLSLECDYNIDPEGNDISTFHVNGKEVSEEEYFKDRAELLKPNNPFTMIDYDGLHLVSFEYDNDGYNEVDEIKSYMTYEEITAELIKLRNEANAEKYKDAEPWKLAYRNKLYDILYEMEILGDGSLADAPSSNGEVVFSLQDITGDELPELLASRDWSANDYLHPDWNIYQYDNNNNQCKWIGRMTFYDSESKKFYSSEGGSDDYVYFSFVIKDGEAVRDVEIGREYQYDGYWYTEYDVNGNEKSSKEVTTNDWDSFEAGYEAGIEKYGIKDYAELTLKNIDIMLGFSDGNIESKKESKGEKEEKTDSSLYTVEVTAPDGYVNFRTGAGTDYEIISPISNGETLSVISDEGKWLQVEYQGKTGWVASSQVTKKAENDADSLLDKFINGEIPAYRHDEYTGKTSSFKITDLPIDEDDSYSYHIGERIDLYNDGEKELILDGADGGMYLDAQNGKIIVLAESDGTASRLSHVTYDGAIWIVYSDTSHAGRQWYELKKYNGAGDVVDSFELSAEYWDSPNDQYNTNSDFHYRGKKISMQEYEDLIKRIFGR